VHYGLFGMVHVQRPPAAVADTILLLSDAAGWSAREDALARALATHGARVVGIDLPTYLQRLQAISEPCSYPAGHFEELAHWIERHEGDADYRTPVVIGRGSGATFAYALVAQAPAGTFSALFTQGWDWSFGLPRAICPGDAGPITRIGADARHHVVATGDFPGEWLPLPGAHLADPARAFDNLRQQLDLPPPRLLEEQAVEDVGVTYAHWREQQDADPVALPDDIADLPLTEIAPSADGDGRIAIMLTGDGGWAGLDKGVAASLAGAGMRVVGFSTLKFFWQKRSPEVAGKALARILAHYAKAWPDARFVVIGYSFGASLVPVLVNRLPATLQQRIDRGIMISPDADAVRSVATGLAVPITRAACRCFRQLPCRPSRSPASTATMKPTASANPARMRGSACSVCRAGITSMATTRHLVTPSSRCCRRGQALSPDRARPCPHARRAHRGAWHRQSGATSRVRRGD
jgi:type IV secretory pathway VirJ component